jgi:hypothetical protein
VKATSDQQRVVRHPRDLVRHRDVRDERPEPGDPVAVKSNRKSREVRSGVRSSAKRLPAAEVTQRSSGTARGLVDGFSRR